MPSTLMNDCSISIAHHQNDIENVHLRYNQPFCCQKLPKTKHIVNFAHRQSHSFLRHVPYILDRIKIRASCWPWQDINSLFGQPTTMRVTFERALSIMHKVKILTNIPQQTGERQVEEWYRNITALFGSDLETLVRFCSL